MPPKKGNGKIPVESLKHQDTRANIPTEELRDFVKGDENKPKTVEYPGLLYARDPSLDPQLVWKGKDEQDREPLTVPSVPVYIQEKIHPRYIIEDIRKHAMKGEPQAQTDLFGDFNGVKNFEEMIDFYQHDVHWSNRMILGDSLLVMNSLADKEGLKGKVQMIYMDPPYGINFGSNWQVSTRKRDVKDGKSEDTTRQPEQIRAFRDTWKLGIHSYLSYLRDRLTIARDLLTDTGSIFMQIGDENIHIVRSVMDEVFGTTQFVNTIIFKKKSATLSTETVFDYLIWYCKNRENIKTHELFEPRAEAEEEAKFNTVVTSDGQFHNVAAANGSKAEDLIAAGGTWARVNYPIVSQHPSETRSKDYVFHGKAKTCGVNKQWRFSVDVGLPRLERAGRLFDGGGESLGGVALWRDWDHVSRSNIWDDIHGEKYPIYVVQTTATAIQRCLLMTTDPGDLVLDPTCGSGTTAYVAEQWGRRWITTDTSRVALALARTRLMSAKYPYYLLSDSEPGILKDAEITGKTPSMQLPKTEGDIRKGFVYKRVPHITLKSIANNDEIDVIHEKWRDKLADVLNDLNKALKKKWQEWEVPREAESIWPDKAKQLLAEWWSLRRERQKEMDEAISRHGDYEYLYDQPYEDNKRVRVAGPFTVESLSPHRVLSTDEPRPVSEVEGKKQAVVGQFETTIIENLKKAGVQNTKKDERLKFDRLDAFAGIYIHAIGEYAEKNGAVRRVAVSIGPEHGTVGPEQVKEAAKEAMKGAGFDLLIVLGFAFDAHAGETVKEFVPERQKQGEFVIAEEAKQFGKLPILLARMNPDLAMGDELLKKTGAGNLFMVFGEPDVDIKKAKDGKLTVKIKGVDVYDPTTGEVRSNKTDDIACWFIDTNYNGESFFVRHAYFTGAEEPYDKLKRALKAEIDESAWSALYKTESRPFDPPDTGKIAIKVINHYGDEVLKVYEVR